MAPTKRNLRTFYILILTQTFSLIGTRISSLAIGIHIFNDTRNATPLTLVAFFSVIPMVLTSNISGVLADRWDRRKVMVLADAGQAAGTALLLLSFVSGNFMLWHLYLVTLIQAVFGVFQQPAFEASITMLVPDSQRDRANAMMQMTQPLSGVIAPAIAGFIYAAVGVEGAIGVDLTTFLVAMLVVFSISIPRPVQTEEGRAYSGTFRREILSGFQYLWHKRVLLYVVLYVSSLNFLVPGAMVLSTPYILARTGSEATLGVILSFMNIGGLIGAIIIGAWGGTRPRMYTILPAIIFASFMMALFGMARNEIALGVTLFMFMVPLPMVNTMFMSIMQTKVPPDLQGRVFAVLGQLAMMLTPLAYLIAGPLADNVFEPAVGGAHWGILGNFLGNQAGAGIGMVMLLNGSIAFVISIVVFAVPTLRNMENILPDYAPVEAEDHSHVAIATGEQSVQETAHAI